MLGYRKRKVCLQLIFLENLKLSIGCHNQSSKMGEIRKKKSTTWKMCLINSYLTLIVFVKTNMGFWHSHVNIFDVR